MRAILLLALLAIAAVPAASAAQPLPVTIDPYVEVGGDCDTCAEADLTVAQTEPKNCDDCGGLGAHAGVETDGRGATVDAQVCRGGIFYVCFVDERVEV